MLVEPLGPEVADLASAREVLAAAFSGDPLMQWLFPEPVGRPDAVAAWLGVFVEGFALTARSSRVAAVDVVHGPDGTIDAVAMWRLESDAVQFSTAPSVGGLLVALVGPERAVELGAGLSAFAANKPEPPFHYLQFLAVHPRAQGGGYGRMLVRHGLLRADAAGVGVYLESTNPANLGFYRALGLSSRGEFVLQPAGPVAFRLWWPPDGASA